MGIGEITGILNIAELAITSIIRIVEQTRGMLSVEAKEELTKRVKDIQLKVNTYFDQFK